MNLSDHLVHACVVCSDFDVSLDFYTRILGATTVTDPFTMTGDALGALFSLPGDPTCRCVFLRWGDCPSYLELQEYREPGSRAPRGPKDIGLARFALRLSDMDAAIEAVRAYGVEIVGGPSVVTLPDGRMRRGFSVHDPDGVLVGLYQYSEHHPF